MTSLGFVTSLVLAEKPIFNNVFIMLTVNRSVPNKGHTPLLALFISNVVLCVVAV